MEVGDDFEGGVALDEGDFHVEGADVYAEDCFGGGGGEGGSQEEKRVEHFHGANCQSMGRVV